MLTIVDFLCGCFALFCRKGVQPKDVEDRRKSPIQVFCCDLLKEYVKGSLTGAFILTFRFVLACTSTSSVFL